eukprot:CAMPEP_0172699962 /NCGR_PEP_ID=MMETSP1074-20121228/30565_1 /TAXON_ID=2916 /ORGANISM="Ceratium fusus, Strain PA161109" /LENGTH=67 /DNA_ID=CAMNT_0013521257 /DNA_START=204 /DNA_END=404 /DNA_ORIENTATION=+
MAYNSAEESPIEQSTEIVEEVYDHVVVEELLRMLQHDRKAIHKVILFLPKQIHDEITSDAFTSECHD